MFVLRGFGTKHDALGNLLFPLADESDVWWEEKESVMGSLLGHARDHDRARGPSRVRVRALYLYPGHGGGRSVLPGSSMSLGLFVGDYGFVPTISLLQGGREGSAAP